MIGGPYVLAALLFVVAIAGAGYEGWHQRGKQADAEKAAILAEAAQKVAEAKQQNAEVSQKVVIQYRDRIKVVREVSPDVQHDVQVIKSSDCKLPPEFLRLYNESTGSESQPAIGADDSAACADAIATLRENNQRARENAEQMKALQAWAEGVAK
jgi:hypothetical protein